MTTRIGKKFWRVLGKGILIGLTSSVAALFSSTSANGSDIDVLLALDLDNNRLVTGQYVNLADTVPGIDTRVYQGQFEQIPSTNLWQTDTPGFYAAPNTSAILPAGYISLPGLTPVAFDANAFAIGIQTANLWHWGGSGNVVFTPVNGLTRLEISSSSPAGAVVLDGGTANMVGFTIQTTTSNGFLRKYMDFEISNTDDSAPLGGFYLWSLTFRTSGYGDSAPVFFVHGLGTQTTEAHEAAIEFVQTNVVPEPTTIVLLLMGGVALLGLWGRSFNRNDPPSAVAGLNPGANGSANRTQAAVSCAFCWSGECPREPSDRVILSDAKIPRGLVGF